MIKYALIGFGGIAENRIAKEGFACDRARFAPLDGVELVGVCDLNPARQSVAESLGLKWYENADAVLADPAIDAVFITTNNMSHAALATAALKAGKHVIVEKPLAATPDEADALVQLAAERKLSLSVDHMMVNNRLNILARDLIQSNRLGSVNDIRLHMEFAYGYDPAEAATWRCSNPQEMGGPIGDVASHCFYVAEFLLDDEIEEVAAVYTPKLMPIVVEDGATIKFRMKNGKTGTVDVAFSTPRGGLGGTLSNLGFEVYGDKAVLRSYGTLFQLSGYEDEPLKIRMELDEFTSQTTFDCSTGESPNIYQGIIMRHAESIKNGVPINSQDGARNVRLCFASHESAQNGGKRVTL